jgi:hypothetical protein
MGYRYPTRSYYDGAAAIADRLDAAGHTDLGRAIRDALRVSSSPLEIAYNLREALTGVMRSSIVHGTLREEAAGVWQLVDDAIEGRG